MEAAATFPSWLLVNIVNHTTFADPPLSTAVPVPESDHRVYHRQPEHACSGIQMHFSVSMHPLRGMYGRQRLGAALHAAFGSDLSAQRVVFQGLTC